MLVWTGAWDLSLGDTGEGYLHDGFINLWNLPCCPVCWQSQINQSWSFRGARVSMHRWGCLSWISGWTSVRPSFHLLLTAVWQLCFTGDLNPPWSGSQKFRKGPASVQVPSHSQGISPEHACTHAQSQAPNLDYILHSSWCRDLVIGEFCFPLKHLQDQIPLKCRGD